MNTVRITLTILGICPKQALIRKNHEDKQNMHKKGISETKLLIGGASGRDNRHVDVDAKLFDLLDAETFYNGANSEHLIK
jgi:hypothetical protein